MTVQEGLGKDTGVGLEAMRRWIQCVGCATPEEEAPCKHTLGRHRDMPSDGFAQAGPIQTREVFERLPSFSTNDT